MADRASGYTTAEKRLPGLDGIRGVAILLVLASHAEIAGGTMQAEWVARLGDLGVKLFFVLSGFLITTLLLKEQTRTGHIAYGRFVVRRAFRILPAAYAFVLCIILAAKAGWIRLGADDAFHALTYTSDFGTPSWWVGHLWSLSIEEQYYLVWPLVLGLVRPRLGAYLMLGTLLVTAIVRGGILLWYPELAEGIERSFVAAVDGFAVGGLVAALMGRLERHQGYLRALGSPWAPAVIPLAAWLDQFEHHPLVFYVVLQSLVYALLAFWIHRSQRVTSDWSARVLNWTWLSWIGTISYSLYLWQQPFLAPASVGVIHDFPAALGLAVVFALLSYHLIERPFLRLRDRLIPPSRDPARRAIVLPTAPADGAR